MLDLQPPGVSYAGLPYAPLLLAIAAHMPCMFLQAACCYCPGCQTQQSMPPANEDSQLLKATSLAPVTEMVAAPVPAVGSHDFAALCTMHGLPAMPAVPHLGSHSRCP